MLKRDGDVGSSPKEVNFRTGKETRSLSAGKSGGKINSNLKKGRRHVCKKKKGIGEKEF